MSVRLDQTVPFGRSLREYELMFSLSSADCRLRILDCAAGPASFNAELTAAGGTVCSFDPLYQFTGAEIQRQFFSTLDQVIEQVRGTPENWVWSHHRDPDDLRQNRVRAMETFLSDYRAGQGTDRYVCGSLPARRQRNVAHSAGMTAPDHDDRRSRSGEAFHCPAEMISLTGFRSRGASSR